MSKTTYTLITFMSNVPRLAPIQTTAIKSVTSLVDTVFTTGKATILTVRPNASCYWYRLKCITIPIFKQGRFFYLWQVGIQWSLIKKKFVKSPTLMQKLWFLLQYETYLANIIIPTYILLNVKVIKKFFIPYYFLETVFWQKRWVIVNFIRYKKIEW